MLPVKGGKACHSARKGSSSFGGGGGRQARMHACTRKRCLLSEVLLLLMSGYSSQGAEQSRAEQSGGHEVIPDLLEFHIFFFAFFLSEKDP